MPITVKRLSDGVTHKFDDIDPKTFIKSLKSEIKNVFKPKYPNGCKLKYANKVMKSRHRLQHYGVMDNETIEMDDQKNWSSSSSSSNSAE